MLTWRAASAYLHERREMERQLREWQEITLNTTRHALALAMAYKIEREFPDTLENFDVDPVVSELADQVARLEEIVV